LFVSKTHIIHTHVLSYAPVNGVARRTVIMRPSTSGALYNDKLDVVSSWQRLTARFVAA